MPTVTGEAICDRIRKVRTINNLSRRDLVEMLLKERKYETNEHYVKKVEEKSFTPNFEFMIEFRKMFDLKWEWLIEGKGKMNN